MNKVIAIAVLALFVGASAATYAADEFEIIKLEKPGKTRGTDKNPGNGTQAPRSDVEKADDKCADDPRLQTELMDILAEDEPVIVPPMQITPETFVSMEQEIIDKLKGQAIICPNNMLLKSGKTLRKVDVPFSILWERIQNAVLDGDEKKLRSLLTNFRSVPLDPESTIKLISNLNFNNDKRKFLYQTANITWDEETPRTPLDFFILTGGKSNAPAIVLYDLKSTRPSLWGEQPMDVEAWKEQNKITLPILLLPGKIHPAHEGYVTSILQSVGIEPRKYELKK